MNAAYHKVRAFKELIGESSPTEPMQLPPARVAQRALWMKSEIDEFETSKDLVEQVDSMVDLIYYALGTLAELGIEPDPVFDVVHQANMRKVKRDGSSRFDAHGKLVKPADWNGPEDEIAKIVRSLQATASHT